MKTLVAFLVWLAIWPLGAAHAQDVELQALGRFAGWRENALIGQGIVVGLAGSGDSPRSAVTRQALRNIYSRLGINVTEDAISSRNVAVVMVVASLPPSANIGDRLSVTVSSAADARSLAGGTLLMTPLMGPNGRPYALAQGPIIAGGDSFESQLNLRQRNYPTTGRIEDGATVEAAVEASLVDANGELGFLLNEPNFTTANRIAEAINAAYGDLARADSADRIAIRLPDGNLPAFVSSIENLRIRPDHTPRVVVNERTGTIVAGGDVAISSVVIAQGDVRVAVVADNVASQPSFISGYANDVRSLIVTNTSLDVDRGGNDVVVTFPSTTVADLATGLSRAHVDTRRIISILEAMKAAGALHADIIIQ